MSEAKHTPGPWKFLPAFGRVETEKRIIAYIAAGVEEGAFRESVPNGSLVAAAPELLEALDELLSAIQDGRRRSAAGDPSAIASSVISATMKQAEAAIRKANGE
jgi:hypothetical protein